MRQSLVTLLIIAVLFLAACGGKKQAELPEYESEVVEDNTGISDERPSTEITETEDLTDQTMIDAGEDTGIEEKALTDMTLEEINTAEFLQNVFFEFDKFRLTDEAIIQLEQNGRWLLQNSSVKVIIEGHCDERGTEEYNLALGERRANASRDFLVRMQITADRLMTASYGESRPLDPNSNEEAWTKNRRAHFRVYSR